MIQDPLHKSMRKTQLIPSLRHPISPAQVPGDTPEPQEPQEPAENLEEEAQQPPSRLVFFSAISFKDFILVGGLEHVFHILGIIIPTD